MRTTLSLLSLLLVAVMQVKALSIGFGEIDYQASELEGGRNFVVQKNDETTGDLVVVITTLLYSEVDPSQIPDEITSLPNAAEFDPKGKQDFERIVETLTFPPSTGNTEQQVFIPFKDDDINEEQEGFWVQVRVNETASDLKDIEQIEYIRNGLALAVINDDDEIRFRFERKEYTVSETAGQQNDLITVIKQDNVTTERTLEVLVQLNPLTGSGAAIQGVDFDIDTLIMVTVPPEEQEFTIPFEVKDDDIAEDIERFNIFLSVPQNGNWLVGTVPNTDVLFVDDDEAIVGFELPEYIVDEGDTVEVCVVFFSPEEIDLFVLGTVIVEDGEARVEEDYEPLAAVDFFIEGVGRRMCYPIVIVDDNETESTETFTVTLIPDETFMQLPPNVRIITNVTTIVVRDNDAVEVPTPPSCDRCDRNADCIGEENTCVCRTGYTGDGETCIDIDECALDIDGCSQDATCINTPGSFRCQCNRGFTGDGFTCDDIDECDLGRDRCSELAVCINIPGSYRCQCIEGFEGNGIICNDVNECFKQMDKCSDNGWCTNTVGSYECTCRRGFAGDGVSCIPLRDEPETEEPVTEEPPCDDDDDMQSDEYTPKTRHTHTRHTHTRHSHTRHTHTHGHTRTGGKTKSRYNPDQVNDDNIPCDDEVQQDEEETTGTKSHTRTPKDGTPRTSGTHKTRHSNTTPRRNRHPVSQQEAPNESTKSKSKSSHMTPRRNGQVVNDEETPLPNDSNESTKSKSKSTKKRRKNRPVASDEGQQAETSRHTSRHTTRHTRRHKSKHGTKKRG